MENQKFYILIILLNISDLDDWHTIGLQLWQKNII